MTDQDRIYTVLQSLIKDQILQARAIKQQAIADKQNIEYLNTFEGTAAAAIRSRVSPTASQGARNGVAMSSRAIAIRNIALGKMYEAVKRYRPKML